MLMAVGVAATLLVSAGCSFDGGAGRHVGAGRRGHPGRSYTLTAVMPTMRQRHRQCPVMMNDATVGSIGSLRVKNWQAELEHCACVRASRCRADRMRVGYTSACSARCMWRSCRPNTSAAATCGQVIGCPAGTAPTSRR